MTDEQTYTNKEVFHTQIEKGSAYKEKKVIIEARESKIVLVSSNMDEDLFKMSREAERLHKEVNKK